MPPTLTRAGAILALALSSGCVPAVVSQGPASPSEPAVPDGLVVERRATYYTVRGDTPAEINGALAVEAPRHRGRRAYGLTDWTLRWRYRPLPGVPLCRLADPRIHLTVRTRLPRWEDRARATGQVGADWDLFLIRLRRHEAGHRERVIREAARALEELRGLAAPTCEGLRVRVEEVVLRSEDRMWEANRRYDLMTGYGVDQVEEMAVGR